MCCCQHAAVTCHSSPCICLCTGSALGELFESREAAFKARFQDTFGDLEASDAPSGGPASSPVCIAPANACPQCQKAWHTPQNHMLGSLTLP